MKMTVTAIAMAMTVINISIITTKKKKQQKITPQCVSKHAQRNHITHVAIDDNLVTFILYLESLYWDCSVNFLVKISITTYYILHYKPPDE